jgi:hypothetical protein
MQEAQKLNNTKLISNLEIECEEAEIILLLARRIVRHILHHHLHRVDICVHLHTSVPYNKQHMLSLKQFIPYRYPTSESSGPGSCKGQLWFNFLNKENQIHNFNTVSA